jgi:hypothetical protein
MYTREDSERLQALSRGDVHAIPWALMFLEADPRCFRAGYVRERLLRYLARSTSQLSTSNARRLRAVLVRAVDDPWRPSGQDWTADIPAVQRMRAKLPPDANAGYDAYRQRRLPYVQRREFKWYCRLAAKLDGADLIGDLREREAGDDEVVARRARLMLGAVEQGQRPAPQA